MYVKKKYITDKITLNVFPITFILNKINGDKIH